MAIRFVSINSSVKLFLFLLLCTPFIGGCAFFGKKVNAFDRQDLARHGMDFIEHPVEEVSVQHMFYAREGTVGGFGGAGGGCGCN